MLTETYFLLSDTRLRREEELIDYEQQDNPLKNRLYFLRYLRPKSLCIAMSTLEYFTRSARETRYKYQDQLDSVHTSRYTLLDIPEKFMRL